MPPQQTDLAVGHQIAENNYQYLGINNLRHAQVPDPVAAVHAGQNMEQNCVKENNHDIPPPVKRFGDHPAIETEPNKTEYTGMGKQNGHADEKHNKPLVIIIFFKQVS